MILIELSSPAIASSGFPVGPGLQASWVTALFKWNLCRFLELVGRYEVKYLKYLKFWL